MINDHANQQNILRRKEFEALGYKFSIGHDGWALFHNEEVVADGKVFTKGEQAYREALDSCVGKATAHRRHQIEQAVQLASKPQKRKYVRKQVVIEEVKVQNNPLHERAVQQAIRFLAATTASYTIEYAGTIFTNAKPAKALPSTHWRPILTPFEGKGYFEVSINVPEEFEFAPYLVAVRAYLNNQYGAGSAITNSDKSTRVLNILVAPV